jgi:hypothetical protein
VSFDGLGRQVGNVAHRSTVMFRKLSNKLFNEKTPTTAVRCCSCTRVHDLTLAVRSTRRQRCLVRRRKRSRCLPYHHKTVLRTTTMKTMTRRR